MKRFLTAVPKDMVAVSGQIPPVSHRDGFR